MKNTTKCFIAAITFTAMALVTSSCIYDAPGDKFYRTLWKSSPEALGPFSDGALTVEFLCDNMIAIKDGSRTIAYGSYTSDGEVAIFSELYAFLEGYRIIFMEAHRNGDTLFLLWRPDYMYYPFTISLNRLSAYE